MMTPDTNFPSLSKTSFKVIMLTVCTVAQAMADRMELIGKLAVHGDDQEGQKEPGGNFWHLASIEFYFLYLW